MDEQMIELVARAIAAAEWGRNARLRRLEKHPGDTAERCAERSWGLWTDHATAAHSVIAGKVAELLWRPIETAPKDEWMLVFIPAEDSDIGQIHAARNRKVSNGYSMIVGHHFASDLAGKPTHWMKLPEPPAALAQGKHDG